MSTSYAERSGLPIETTRIEINNKTINLFKDSKILKLCEIENGVSIST